MNRLEQLGFELVAADWMGLERGTGLLLRRLLAAAPNPVAYDRLCESYMGSKVAGRRMARNSLSVRMCWMREALADLGFSGAVKTTTGAGYQIDRETADRITAAILERVTP